MLEEIEIQNFRCFEETKISGFERVNLIGGKNNSGKTALLEALYLFNAPLPQGILFLMQLRKESLSFSKAFPERTWDHLFFRGKKDKELGISSRVTTEIQKKIVIYVEIKNDNTLILNDNQELSKEIINSNKLNLLLLFTSQKYTYIESGKDFTLMNDVLQSSFKGISIFDKLKDFKTKLEIFKKVDSSSNNIILFIPANQRHSSQELAVRYDQCVLNNQSSEILNIIKIIDPSIEEIRTLSLGEPQIYLRRTNEDFLPISLFGDALNRIIEIVINLIDVKNGILLIDEIENGIHYLNQREFWVNLFKLAKALDVQIFATTHSLEMIKAFADVGLNEYPEEAAYIELARHAKTHQIIGIKRDMETLDYALEHEKGVGLRGE